MMSLDHIGLVGSSMAPLRQAWIAAGFFVTEPEELMGLDPTTGRHFSLGQHSCHIILERGYIELTAVDVVTPKHHLYPWIRDHVSLGIIAIGVHDIESAHARLMRLQVPVGSLAKASRPIHYGARRGEALFSWFALDAASTPEALMCFVRNERPELIYQPEVQQHPNGARFLDSVIVCASEPSLVAARYSSYFDSTPLEAGPRLLQCPLSGGSVWIGDAEALENRFGVDVPRGGSDAPRAVGFGVLPSGQIYWVPEGT